MKNFLIYFFCLTLILGLTSCNEVEPLNHGVEIQGLPDDTSEIEGTVLSFNLEIKAEDGISIVKMMVDRKSEVIFDIKGQKSVTLPIEIPLSVDWNKTNGEVTYDFFVSFYIKDSNHDVLHRQLKVTVLKEPQKDFEKPRDDGVLFESVLIERDVVTNETWESGKVYLLKGQVTVVAPAVLTIEPGALIKALYHPTSPTSLVISRGAKIHAKGSGSSPIIFTTEFDRIKPNELNSDLSTSFFPPGYWDIMTLMEHPNMEAPVGWWGGLIILGNAPGSYPNDGNEAFLNGKDSQLRYGGNNEFDDSGILSYISIRFAGNPSKLTSGYSSLMLGGVGSQTRIENVEILSSAGDGISIFGGAVSLTNLIAIEMVGNGVRIDQGWYGMLNNFVFQYVKNQVFDISGPTLNRYKGNHQIKNGSVLAFPSKGLVSLSNQANTILSNVFFYDISSFLEKGIDQVANSFGTKVEKIEFHIPNEIDYSGTIDWDNAPLPRYPQEIFLKHFSKWDRNLVKQVDMKGYSVGPKLSPFKQWSVIFRPYEVENGFIPGF